jgi:MFS family permease
VPATGAVAVAEPGLGLTPNLVVVLLCTAVVGCCIAMSMPLVHLPKYVVERGFTLGQGASILGVLMATSIVSRVTWGFVCDRIGGLPTLFVTSATQAAALAVMAATSSYGGLYGVAVFFGLGFGGILPCYPVILRQHLPLEGLGPRVGLIVLFGSIGMALGPEIAGRVFAVSGSYSLGFAAGVAANLGNLAIVGFLNLRRLRGLPLPSPA